MNADLHLTPGHHAPVADKAKVEIRDLCFFYGETKSLKNISLPLM